VPWDITDTNAIVPAGASKLRVAHFAASAPAVTIRRRQPDFDSLMTVMFPFAYRAVSAYLQSTPGYWSVVVSHENQSDTLAVSGSFYVGDGERRTVVLVDDPAGGVGLLVLDP
jgi:hypothetical protein